MGYTKLPTDMNVVIENLGELTSLMTDVCENQERIIQSNESSAESLLQIQRMMFALVVLVIIITLINVGFLMMQSRGELIIGFVVYAIIFGAITTIVTMKNELVEVNQQLIESNAKMAMFFGYIEEEITKNNSSTKKKPLKAVKDATDAFNKGEF